MGRPAVHSAALSERCLGVWAINVAVDYEDRVFIHATLFCFPISGTYSGSRSAT